MKSIWLKHTDLHYLLNFVKHSDQFILLFYLLFLFVVDLILEIYRWSESLDNTALVL